MGPIRLLRRPAGVWQQWKKLKVMEVFFASPWSTGALPLVKWVPDQNYQRPSPGRAGRPTISMTNGMIGNFTLIKLLAKRFFSFQSHGKSNRAFTLMWSGRGQNLDFELQAMNGKLLNECFNRTLTPGH